MGERTINLSKNYLFNSLKLIKMRKFKSILALTTLCGIFAMSSKSVLEQPKDANAWVGVAYMYAKHTNDSAEMGALFGVVGSVESTLFGYAAAGAWGGPAGAAVGLAVGL